MKSRRSRLDIDRQITSGEAPIDVVLFDNDGVLVDTEPLFFQATREILESVSIEVDPAHYHQTVLREGKSIFELARARGHSDEALLALRARRDERYADLIEAGVRVLDGVVELLQRLHGQLPMAIVTSSGRDHFERIHRQTGVLPFFDFVLADGDYDRHKPHPDPYLRAAARYGVDPARCLVIEDTERGLSAAHAAGMPCIVIPHELTRAGDFGRALHVLPSMHELASVLGLD